MSLRRSQRNAALKTKDSETNPSQAIRNSSPANASAIGSTVPPEDCNPDDTAEERDESLAAETTSEPPKKRVKDRAKSHSAETGSSDAAIVPKRRGKRGILQKMNDTPLDVLFEIFSYLEPLDLLRMSRMTKDLRQLLMSKSSAFVWERARLGIEGLPPKMDSLNEAQFANLLFDNHCHSCGKANVKYVQWEIRMRLCKNCLETGDLMTAAPHEIVPWSLRRSTICDMTPMYILKQSTGRYQTRRLVYYHVSSLRILGEESDSLNDFAYNAWTNSKAKERLALVQECKQFIQWESSRKNGRTAELSDLRKERFESIVAKLRLENWTEELKSSRTILMLHSHKSVNQPKALTERMWLNMHDSLTEAMTKMRAELNATKERTAVQRRTDLLKQLYSQIIEALPELPVKPLASQIARYEPFASIITKTALLDDVTKEHFAEGLKTLPDIFVVWRDEIEAHLKKLLLAAGHSDDLGLVQNMFTCSRCRKSSLLYPELTRHTCFIVQEDWLDTRVAVTDQIRRDEMRRLIDLAGLDPATATSEDMDTADALFSCGSCYDSQYAYTRPTLKQVYTIPWRSATTHVATTHSIDSLRVVDPAHLPHAREVRSREVHAKMSVYSSYNSTYFACQHCDVLAKTSEGRKTHLLIEHEIEGNMSTHYRPILSSRPGAGNNNNDLDCIRCISMSALYPELEARLVKLTGMTGDGAEAGALVKKDEVDEFVEIYSMKASLKTKGTTADAGNASASASAS